MLVLDGVWLVKLFVFALYILGYLDIEIDYLDIEIGYLYLNGYLDLDDYLDLDGYLSECLLNVGLDGGDYK